MNIHRNVWIRLKKHLKSRPMVVFFWNYFIRMRRGYRVYRSILKTCGDDVQIYVEHYPGTGDIYITCALLEAYLEQTGDHRNYIVTIIGKGSVKIAKLLGIQNTVLLTQRQSDDLLMFYRFMGPEAVKNITVLHYSPIMFHTSVLDQMASYNGLDFMTMYLAAVFPGVSWDQAKKFPPCSDPERIEEYFDERGLIPEKTVVLFPYANTIQPVNEAEWEKLARKLREDGYMVCTNVEKGGAVIPGTETIFVPYADIVPFAERCGCLVGLRSGIFDMLADSQCRKVVLYPTPNYFKFGVGTIFDYFSLVNMGIAKNAYEIEFERINTTYVFRDAYHLIHDLMSGNTPELPPRKKYNLKISKDAVRKE